MGNDQAKLKTLQSYNPKNFGDINLSLFTQDEVSTWFSGFIAANNTLTKDKLVAEYNKFFTNASAETFATNAFALLDVDSTGVVSVRELIASVVLSAKGQVEQRLYWTFNLFDEEDTGSLDKAAVTGIARAIMKLDPKTKTSSSDLTAKADIWYETIPKFDGRVYLSDFLDAAKKDPTLSTILNPAGTQSQQQSTFCSNKKANRKMKIR